MRSKPVKNMLVRTGRLGASLLLSGLVAFATLTVPTSGQQATQTVNGVPIPPGISRARAEQMILAAQREAKTVANIRKILSTANLPFDASILFTRNWRQKVAAFAPQLPQLQENRALPNNIAGAQIAGTFAVPKKVSITEDTVIIANRLTFPEPETLIKGPHSIYVFLLSDDAGTDDMGTDATSSGKGTITIDVSGLGRKECLASIANQTSSLDPEIIDDSGRRGQDGRNGNFVPAGSDGLNAGINGPNGICPQVDGIEGFEGDSGNPATQPGEDAGNGEDGGDGKDIVFPIPEGSTKTYHFLANGGDGGNGGQGGPGGQGGNGKPGGNGGDGSFCGCTTVGRGARGGRGGNGGPGSTGGKGGNGGKGGKAGSIKISYHVGFNLSLIAKTDADGGTGGRRGRGGNPGPGGQPGAGGKGGKGARPNIQPCNLGGQDGPDASYGIPGVWGARGPEGLLDGANGASGSVIYDPINSGSGNLMLEPGGPGGGGICYDWVLYECNDIDPIEDPGVNGASLNALQCRERMRWPAGCW